MPKQGMIVAPQPEAVEAGVEIMRAGGNAVDGAIACALVQGVVDPMMCGIAGSPGMRGATMSPATEIAINRSAFVVTIGAFDPSQAAANAPQPM